MSMKKRDWLKDSTFRLVATVLGAILAIIAAGALFDWRAAMGILVPAVIGCVVYSLHKLFKKKKEGRRR